MAFNVMAANGADHSKNFSFILRRGQAWALAPAYDLTFAFDPANKWTRQHLTGVNGKFAGITVDDMLTVAERFGIGGAPRVLREVRQAMKDWPEFAAQAIDGQTRRSGLHGPFAVEPSGIVIAMIQKPRPSRLLRCHA